MLDAAAKLKYGGEFRRCLVEMDVAGMRNVWHHCMPNMPLASTTPQVIATMHMARVYAESVPAHLRIYSRDWLRERGLGVTVDMRELIGRKSYAMGGKHA